MIKIRLGVLQGANLHAPRSVLRLTPLETNPAVPPDAIAAALRMVDLVPSHLALPPLAAPVYGPDRPAPTTLEMITLLAVAMQRRIGHRADHHGLQRAGNAVAYAWFSCTDPDAARDSARSASALVRSLLTLRPGGESPQQLLLGLAGRIDADLLREAKRAVHPTPWILIRALQRYDYPYRAPKPDCSMFEAGTGKRSRRFFRTIIEPEQQISNKIQSNKRMTTVILRDAGISVPDQLSVTSAEAAAQAAEDIGFPVVVKPIQGAQARGVELDLRTPADVRAAYLRSSSETEHCLVERYFVGQDYRLLTIDGELFYAYRRGPFEITGDGVSTLGALIEAENRDPRRGTGRRYPLDSIDLDGLTRSARSPLTERGLTMQSVLAAGERVPLSFFGSQRKGGIPREVTGEVHVDYRRLARRIHAVVPIHACGIDLLSTDISAPIAPGSYAVNEINSAPGLNPFMLEGAEPPSSRRFVERVFGSAAACRVPMTVILGPDDGASPEPARAAAAALQAAGLMAAQATRQGYRIGDWLIDPAPQDALAGTVRALEDREADAIVVERTPAELLRTGLGETQADLLIAAPGPGGHAAELLDRVPFLAAACRSVRALDGDDAAAPDAAVTAAIREMLARRAG